jgi:hypothetical protein
MPAKRQPAALAAHPDAGTEPVPATVRKSVSNAPPLLGPNAISAAARAHATLAQIVQMCVAAQADIERYVASPVLRQAAEQTGRP